MNRLFCTFAIAVVTLQSLQFSFAQDEDPVTRMIFIQTSNGWTLLINSDGSGRLMYGAVDGWSLKAGTIDVAQAEQDLRLLKNDPNPDDFYYLFSFQSERKAPDQPGPRVCTRDGKVISRLLMAAENAASVRNESDAQRLAYLLKKSPFTELPQK